MTLEEFNEMHISMCEVGSLLRRVMDIVAYVTPIFERVMGERVRRIDDLDVDVSNAHFGVSKLVAWAEDEWAATQLRMPRTS
ncbi:hypothetical protein [Amycolatopsis minnesotensis]|uniref:Uncharacterized protein n=1 Tax=Amycolatopsis minnesotensis TaxID=337894 RepID=A0ABP5EAK9_9PSEU